ncbi:MAG: hypothetical protein NVSMB51_11670 [Solirubrobacteraceae bacterium]
MLSWKSTGARATGTIVCTTKTTGATWIAGRSWRALISLSRAIAEAIAEAAPQATALAQWPSAAASATNFVTTPPQANPAPAPSIVTLGNE